VPTSSDSGSNGGCVMPPRARGVAILPSATYLAAGSRQIRMNSYTTEHGIDAIVSNMLITLMLLYRERVDQLSARYPCKCLYKWHLLAERVGFEPCQPL
jgi:hypothetical protein